MRILITGGNGFIARNLLEQLKDEYDVLSCGSAELDLLDTSKVSERIVHGRFDVIIHTATYDPAPKYSTKDPAKVLANNLMMFFNIARCRNYFGKLIYFGSGAEYDRDHWTLAMKEKYFDCHVPKDQYGFSKYVMAKYALSNDDIYNLRIMSIFGKYEDWRYRFISKACCHALFGVPITINRNSSYDFMYIDDLVKIVKWFIDNKPKSSVYNVCSGRTHNFSYLASKVAEISGKNIEVTVKSELPGKEYGGDNSLLMDELNGFEFSPIESSIDSLYRWYEANGHIIDPNELC